MSYPLQKLFTLMLHHFQPINLIFVPILDFICSLPLLISRATSFLSCKALSLLQRVGDRRGGRIRHSLWFEHCCEKPESFEVYFIKIIKRKDLVGVMSYLSTYSLDLKRKATADTSGLGEVFVLNISTRHVTLRRTTRPTDFELQFLFPWGTALFSSNSIIAKFKHPTRLDCQDQRTERFSIYLSYFRFVDRIE